MKKYVSSVIACVFMLLPNAGKTIEIGDSFLMSDAEARSLDLAIALGILKTDPSLNAAFIAKPEAMLKILSEFLPGHEYELDVLTKRIREGSMPVEDIWGENGSLPELEDSTGTIAFAVSSYAYDILDDWCGTPYPGKWPKGPRQEVMLRELGYAIIGSLHTSGLALQLTEGFALQAQLNPSTAKNISPWLDLVSSLQGAPPSAVVERPSWGMRNARWIGAVVTIAMQPDIRAAAFESKLGDELLYVLFGVAPDEYDSFPQTEMAYAAEMLEGGQFGDKWRTGNDDAAVADALKAFGVLLLNE